ncbi:MAG TPA: FeoC-like transcriptional regulator [Propionicimonas sp.]
MTGPLTTVLAEMQAGAPTVAEIVRRSGLEDSVVRAAVDHLVRSGRVESRELSMGCPASGCGGCASATDDGAPGCGLPSPVPGRRAGLVTLSLARR